MMVWASLIFLRLAVISDESISAVGTRTSLTPLVEAFLRTKPTSELRLGGEEDYGQERQHHTEILGWHKLLDDTCNLTPIHDVELTAVRTLHSIMPAWILYPKNGEEKRSRREAGALV
jgi:hypothetical protein